MKHPDATYFAYVRRGYCTCQHHLTVHDEKGLCTASVMTKQGPVRCSCQKAQPLGEKHHAPR